MAKERCRCSYRFEGKTCWGSGGVGERRGEVVKLKFLYGIVGTGNARTYSGSTIHSSQSEDFIRIALYPYLQKLHAK
jgi:hypothetical protein